MSGPTDSEPHTDREADRAALARAFDATAAAYELGRPDYPDEALTFWDDHGAFEPGNVVLDLAAGTGKLTRLLPLICELHAVEPLAQMRAEFERAVPDVTAVVGTAESIPFPDDHFDAVLVGQAFHWFDHTVALDEIARVLKPGGGLGLIWNEDDADAAPWLTELADEKRAIAASTVNDVRSAADIVSAHARFDEAKLFECPWEFPTSVDGVLADVLSRSYVSALAGAEQLAVLTRAREALQRHLGADVATISYPYRTTAIWATRLS